MPRPLNPSHNVRAMRATAAGHQVQAGENVPCPVYRVPPDRAWWPAVGAPVERGVGISALGADVEPRAPGSDKPIFLEEPLRDRVVTEVISVGKTNRVRYETKWVRLVGKDMLDSPAKLTRRCIRLSLVMFWMSGV